MAILSKIRDRSMFLILIVGLALFAFVLDPSSIQQFFSSSKVNSIGEVNGEDIDREEFARQVEAYRTQSGGRASQMQAVNAVWSGMISEKIFEDQLEKAGIVIGEKDIWDAMTSLQEIQNSPLFKNEANLFDEEKLKEYIANMKDDAESGNSQAWMNWLATEKNIKQNLQRQAYTSLVKAGLGASLKEGERDYLFNNTKMDAEFVYVPYSTIADSLAYVSKQEIQNYLKDNSKRFKTEAGRTLKYVKFDILPSEADDAEAKKLVESYIEDREEYSNAAKATVKIAGLKNTTKYESFLNDNRSDLAIDNGYKYKNQILAEISDEVFNAEVGTVVGPYKQNGYYKISKVVETIQLPDSVKSSHIIVPYAGTTRSTSLKTKEQAKKTADSVFALVKNNKSKFTEIADEINSDGTKGKGGDIGWVRKDQAFSPSFDADFANFIYKNKVGSIDVVETAFGFHIIRIDDQTKAEKAVKLVTFARLVEASEETENRIFEEAETLNANLSEGRDIDEIATEMNYNVQMALNLKVLDEVIPGLGAQRQMVTWAFENERELDDSKRFDIDVAGKRGYAVAVLSGKVEKDGIAVSSELLGSIRPELVDKKKADIIKKKMSGATLEEIATNSGVTVRSASGINLSSPLISGVGNEPAVVGAMSTIKLNEVSDILNGEKGVFVFKVTKRDAPIALENYDTFRKKIVTQLQARGNQIFNVLEETADIKDNRGKFF
ncbi:MULTISPECIES: peptidylprolyl isomerase [Flavobacteriaceae]|uniref:Periplasmic chaperone PpiD n=3 Tax=Flavobacteriaceae TaxID=49546 RepID=A0A4Y8ATJ2_9FLAO|nr:MULTISPECIES: SurA N-terminal domain-containing protein [Flavobacteriaceae]TEW75187.1 peptidylprolyl isomerase [Gramella jeungdoensis]GGK40853.1 peptidylprolyl isomerase [Lutibacter litoralis]